MKNEHYEGVASFNIAYYSMDSKKIFCFLTFYPFGFFKTYIFLLFCSAFFSNFTQDDHNSISAAGFPRQKLLTEYHLKDDTCPEKM